MEDAMEVAGVGDETSSGKETLRKRSGVSIPPKKRVSQACGRCRGRKDKCDGKRPACSTCLAAEEVCTYDPPTKKRGLPEGYVRGLEKLWGISLRKSDGLEEVILKILGTETETSDFDSLEKLWNDKEGGETLLNTWRKSNVYQELERLLPLLEPLDDKPRKRTRRDNAPGRVAENYVNPPLSPSTRIEPEAERKSSAERLPNNEDGSADAIPSHVGSKISAIPREVPKLTIPPLPDRTWHLIDIFFSYTHCWFPIIEKHDILRISYQYSQKEPTSSSSQSGNHAVLWAILAYAEHQDGTIGPPSRSKDVGSDWTVDRLYKEAKMLIPPEEGTFELDHVQALLILTLLNMGLGYWSRAWLLVGQAVRVAIDLGLSKGRAAADKKSQNAQVFLGCFALDTLVALQLGRTPQLRVSDLKLVGLVEEDGSAEWNPWEDSLSMERHPPEGRRGPAEILSTFNRLIPLIAIINRITHDVSTGTRRADKCQELIDELGSWGEILPTRFTPAPDSRDAKSPSFLPHQYHLHLAHLGAVAAVYRHLDALNTERLLSNAATLRNIMTSAHQTMWLLIQYSERFGLSIIPPTFDCFTKITLRGLSRVPRHILDEQKITCAEWQGNMLRSLSTMTAVWPTFENLRMILAETTIPIDSRPLSLPTSATDVQQFNTFDPGPSQLTPQSIASNHPPGYNPGVCNEENKFHLIGTHSNIRPQNTPTQPILSGLIAPARSPTSWQDPRISWNQFTDRPLTDSCNAPNTAGTFGSHIEGDLTFDEFATLDAMEW